MSTLQAGRYMPPPPQLIYRGGPPPVPGFFPPPGGLPNPIIMSAMAGPPPGAPGMLPQMPPPPPPVPYDPRAAPAPGGPPLIQQRVPESYVPMMAPQPQPQPPAAPPKPKIGAHIPLAKCRVLYIGTAIPTETSEGIKAVQEPLNKRYVTDSNSSTKSATSVPGIDAWLTIFSSGVMLQYITEKNETSNNYVSWFPIHTLHVSAAVKCIPQMRANGERYCEFVALDSPAAGRSDHPPIFSMIMRRTKGVKVLENHAFICKSNQAAMALVESSTHAYEHKEGWVEDEPPKDIQTLEGTLNTQDADAEPTVPLFQPSTQKARDRPNSKSSGYFLLIDSNNKLVKGYNVHNPNKLAPPKPKPAPPAIPHEPQPSGMYVPAPNQYLSDFGDFRGYPVMEFPGFVSPEAYKATMSQRRRTRPGIGMREYATYDRVNTLPPPPPRPRPMATEQPVYLAPTKYDFADDMGNHYYTGGKNEMDHSYRGYLPRAQHADDVAYLAPSRHREQSEYARYIPTPEDDRAYDDRRRDHRGYNRRFDDRTYDRRHNDRSYPEPAYEDRRRYDPRDDRRVDDHRMGNFSEFGLAGFYP